MEPPLHPAVVQLRFQKLFDPDFEVDSDFDVSPLLSGPAAFEFGRVPFLFLVANVAAQPRRRIVHVSYGPRLVEAASVG